MKQMKLKECTIENIEETNHRKQNIIEIYFQLRLDMIYVNWSM